MRIVKELGLAKGSCGGGMLNRPLPGVASGGVLVYVKAREGLMVWRDGKIPSLGIIM